MKRLKLFRATLAFLIICALRFMNGKTITAIVNESVVLPSGVPSNFHPTDIQWSLFSNVTLIATLISDKIRDDWYEQFKNRLKLHTNNASLEILQLRTQDSLTYYVSAFYQTSIEHKSEITLIVYDKLHPPKLEVLQTSNENSECTFKFECSVQQVKNVDYFWNAMSTNVTWKENAPSLENRTSVLKISQVPINLNVTYNCKVSNNMTNASATMSVSCIDKLQPPKLEVLQTSNENSECTFKFECSVQQVKNVDYFWNAMSTNVTWKENAPSLENRTSVLKISQVPVNLNVTYNCKVSNNMTNASATMSVSCIAITNDSHRHQTLLIIAFFFVLFVIICSNLW